MAGGEEAGRTGCVVVVVVIDGIVGDEKLSMARVAGSPFVAHPPKIKQPRINSEPVLRMMQNLLSIDAVFLDVCSRVKLC